MSVDGDDIARWRKANRIKQAALAEMLSVSQATISKWESGDSPVSKAALLRLNEVISDRHNGRLAMELACVAPQEQAKVLVRGRGFQLIGVSKGFLSLWPVMGDFVGQNTRDFLVNEAASYCEDHDYLREAEDGELLMITGVSNRMLCVGTEVNKQHRMRWHAIVRQINSELIHEVIYEPCAAETAVGFEKILRRSDVCYRPA